MDANKKDAEQKLLALGWAVRKRRSDLALSQEELAERAELHRNYIGGIERGERNIGFVNLTNLAEALELSLSDLAAHIEHELKSP